ncbi:MAG: iron-containing alcohol dehydrogenase [Solirubrobacterales bacterium]
MSFEHHTPTRIVFGRGAVAELGGIAAAHGGAALLVCGRGAMRRLGVLDRVVADLGAAGLSVAVHDGISPDPKVEEVDAAIALARREGCDLVVGLGGGSAVDAAKAAGVGAGADHASIADLVGRTLAPSPGSLPVIAVPTTTGSGAEVTKGAILTDGKRGVKAGIRGIDVFPRVAVVDPALAATQPPQVFAETAFDALTHALEGYVARRANPLTEPLAERALDRLGANLPRIAAGDRGEAVCEEMALAALLGGLNVAAASTCLPHRLQQAMGAVPRVGISHGRGLAAIYPAWLERAYPFAGARFDRAGSLLGNGDVRATVGELREALELTTSLTEWGFETTDVDELLAGVQGNVENDPIEQPGPTVMREIYAASF